MEGLLNPEEYSFKLIYKEQHDAYPETTYLKITTVYGRK